jgi:LmbE family N-acetylglucosaminyl deacetylase
LALAAAAGETTSAVFLTSGELGLEELPADEARALREAEAEKAAEILGLAKVTFLRHPDWFLADASAQVARYLRKLMEREAPTDLLCPHPDEWHPDHAATATIVRDALGDAGGGLRLQTYEVWTPMTCFDEVNDISTVMETKLTALRAYRSQLSKFSYEDAVEGLDRFRGALAARCRYAEVFGSFEPGSGRSVA